MKSLTLIVILLLSPVTHADVSQFKGRNYTKDQTRVCEQDLADIKKTLSGVEGFSVLNGGCLTTAPETISLRFDYLHPLASRIENFSASYTNVSSCGAANVSARRELLASGNLFVASHCEDTQLTTHFINTNHSVLRSIGNLGTFSDPSDCSATLALLASQAEKFEIHPFMLQCLKKTYNDGKQTVFDATFNYIASYDTELAAIPGETHDSYSECGLQHEELVKTFADNHVSLVYDSCARAAPLGEKVQRTILYMKPQGTLKLVTNYTGFLVENQSACELQLSKITQKLNESGQNVLYGFCSKAGDKNFWPSVSYLRPIQL
jgi:hypothetical protein